MSLKGGATQPSQVVSNAPTPRRGVREKKESPMPAVVDREKCDGCKSCEECCPTQSILVQDDNIAAVKVEECIDCNACMDACPTGAITME